MYELKTKLNDASVDKFLGGLADPQQREDSVKIIEMMSEITGLPPKMWGGSIVGFGSYHYVYDSGHEGDMCLIGFAPRKNALSLYFCSGLGRLEAQLKKLGKYKAGKGCLYIKKLADVDLGVLRAMIEDNVCLLKQTSKPADAKPTKRATRKPSAQKHASKTIRT